MVPGLYLHIRSPKLLQKKSKILASHIALCLGREKPYRERERERETETEMLLGKKSSPRAIGYRIKNPNIRHGSHPLAVFVRRLEESLNEL